MIDLQPLASHLLSRESRAEVRVAIYVKSQYESLCFRSDSTIARLAPGAMNKAGLAFSEEAFEEPSTMAVRDMKHISSLLEVKMVSFDSLEYFKRISFLLTHQ